MHPSATDPDSASGNLFKNLAAPTDGEVFEELLQLRQLRIERIVSSDHPHAELYDQDWDEWVCLLQGEATLWIAGQTIRLQAGDYRLIPAHTPHRVLQTAREPACLWLAVHLLPASPAV